VGPGFALYVSSCRTNSIKEPTVLVQLPPAAVCPNGSIRDLHACMCSGRVVRVGEVAVGRRKGPGDHLPIEAIALWIATLKDETADAVLDGVQRQGADDCLASCCRRKGRSVYPHAYEASFGAAFQKREAPPAALILRVEAPLSRHPMGPHQSINQTC